MQDMLWETKDGRTYLVSSMDTRHIQNCLRLIRKSKMIRKPWRIEYEDRMQLELDIRTITGRTG